MNKKRSQPIIAFILLLSLTFATVWSATAQDGEPPRAAPRPGGLEAWGPAVDSAIEYKAGEVLVKLKGIVATSTLESMFSRYEATYVRTLVGGDIELWQVPAGRELEVAEQLSIEPAVEYAEPNYRYTAFGMPNDPEFNKQWGHDRMDSEAAWDISTGSTGITVAIIDTGIDPGHPDLAGKIVAGYDFVDGDSNPTDTNGHGTHVAGIAAAITNNGVGVAGMNWQARIMPVRVLDTEGSGWTADIVDGTNWAWQNGAKVLNLSLGGPTFSQSMQDAVNAATAAGSLVVAAMGNDNTSDPSYPAAYTNVLAVSATGPTDGKSYFSNYGSHCDVAAPGGEMSGLHDPDGIYSTMPTYSVYMNTEYGFDPNYDFVHGTSQASPYVAGLASLIWSVDPGLTPAEVQTIIEDTADDLGAAGWDQYYGHGRVNAYAALSSLQTTPETPVLASISNPDGDGNYTVDWNDAAGADSYLLQEDDNAGFSSPSTAYSGSNSYHMVSGKGPGTWYYRVRASNSSGDSGWSNSRSVTVKPNAPTLYAITNPGNDDAYTVSWAAATSATSYSLQEDDNASFTSPRTRYVGPALEYHVTGQMPGTWYYRVRGYNSAGAGAWSTSQSTTVDPAPLDPPSLSVISNPDGDGDYLVDWSDVTGATGYLLEQSDEPYFVNPTVVYSGAASQLAVSDQPSGHWFYRVRATGASGNSPWSLERSVIVITRVYLPFVAKNYHPVPESYGLPIYEGFEGGLVPPSGWTNHQYNPRQTWQVQNYGAQSGSYAAQCMYDDGGVDPPNPGYQNEVLLSPDFKASSAQLSFYSYGSLGWCRDSYDNCDLNIWLVVGAWGGGDDIYVYTADQDWIDTWAWSYSSVDLTPFLPAGSPVRVGFQYEGQDGAQISLDAISITGN